MHTIESKTYDTILGAGMNLTTYVQNIEQQLVYAALQRTNGNKTAAATLLGIKRTTLQMKLKSWSASGQTSQGN